MSNLKTGVRVRINEKYDQALAFVDYEGELAEAIEAGMPAPVKIGDIGIVLAVYNKAGWLIPDGSPGLVSAALVSSNDFYPQGARYYLLQEWLDKVED
jgi:hypothetical protein